MATSHFNILATPILLLLTSFFFNAVSAAPIHFDFGEWLKGELFPKAGANINSELQCYSLPYGGYGFLSHVLTYYTVICTMFGRRPFAPWSELQKGRFDIFLTIFSTLGTIIPASFTISSCRNRWQFILLGVWKLMLALCSNFSVLHQAIAVRNGGAHTDGEAAWTLIVYILGTIIGLVGLFSLVAEGIPYDSKIRIVTYVFGGIVGVPAIAFTMWLIWCLFASPFIWCCAYDRKSKYAATWGGVSFSIFVGLFTLLAAFYSDWSLAAITHNWSGSPSDDNKVLYWTYFAAKRLLLFVW
ncbi:hypothetical protein BT63DRAFT_210961 [Microthyrium microscopicum]|uniref:Uncharacterized protein n=1 Tax=Microthyrium microscopicum TaxID=703497 RepID=A0A6A6UIE7_9PEZI|nr:hypothetical protein BT63DRAFT_210961 [Microthyrium microscopicum]